MPPCNDADHLRIFFVLLLFAFPCYVLAGNDPIPSELIPITLPGGTIIHAELANTPQKRAEGLMYREQLADDRGMLFTFPQAQAWVFWMKNTKISLDLIWINEKKQVVHMEQQRPNLHENRRQLPTISAQRRCALCVGTRSGPS